MPLSGLVYVVSSSYETEGLSAADPPAWLKDGGNGKIVGDEKYIRVLTLDELLPLSFGPESLNF